MKTNEYPFNRSTFLGCFKWEPITYMFLWRNKIFICILLKTAMSKNCQRNIQKCQNDYSLRGKSQLLKTNFWNSLRLLSHLLVAGCRGWSGGAKVLCILHHWGVQLILAYSWARPAILVVGKGRGGMFLFLLFLHFHSCSSFFPVPLFHLLYSLFYLFSPFLWETTQNDPQGLTCR